MRLPANARERVREQVRLMLAAGLDPLKIRLRPNDPADLTQVHVAEQIEAKLLGLYREAMNEMGRRL